MLKVISLNTGIELNNITFLWDAASKIGIPNPSYRDGNTNNSQYLYNLDTDWSFWFLRILIELV